MIVASSLGMSRVTATCKLTGSPPIEATKLTVGRKESSTPRFKSFVADVKGVGVSVDWLLTKSDRLEIFTQRDAYNPIEIDSLRDFNGRSSSEPGGTYAQTISVLVFKTCITHLP